MKLIDSIRNYFSGSDSKSETDFDTKASDGSITIDMLGAKNGSVITENKAMKIEAFYSCVRDKAETIGQLPVKLYSVSRQSQSLILQGRNHRIFTQSPCEHMTMQNFLEMVVACYEINGAFYAYPVYNDRGEVMEVIPFLISVTWCLTWT